MRILMNVIVTIRMVDMMRHMRQSFITAFILCVASVSLSLPLTSQTKFLWPSDQIDIGQYKYIDVCYAVQSRVNDSAESRSNYRDSMHYSENDLNRVRRPAIVAATKRCMQRFSPNQIVPEDFTLAQELYLIANEDAQAKAVAARRMQAIAALSAEAQIENLDTMIALYVYAEPIRLDAVMELFDRMEELTRPMGSQKLIHLYARMMFTATEAGQDSMMSRIFPKITALVKTFTDAEFDGLPGQQAWFFMEMAMKTVYRDRLLARLEESTRKYLDEPKVIFTELVGRAPPATPDIAGYLERLYEKVGQPTKIYGDYWFPAKPDSVTYPRKGVVTILYPVDENFGQVIDKGNRENGSFLSLIPNGAAYRRLKAKWPELEFVFTANTLGFLKVMEPPPPEREAIMLDSMYRHFYKLPGVLSVSKTEFWRLPGYDRRRINELTENQKLDRTVPQTMVIDKEGVMVLITSTRGNAEKQLEETINALMKRPYQGDKSP